MTQLRLFNSNPALFAGLDIDLDGKVRVVFIDQEAAEYPDTTDLHRCSTMRTFERFWEKRFKNDDQPVIVGLQNPDPPGLPLWLAERGASVLDLGHFNLLPFLEEATNYEIPFFYRRAHALAQCAAIRTTAPQQLQQLHGTIFELNFHLRELEKALYRISSACSSPTR